MNRPVVTHYHPCTLKVCAGHGVPVGRIKNDDNAAYCAYCGHHADSHSYRSSAESAIPCRECLGGACDQRPRDRNEKG